MISIIASTNVGAGFDVQQGDPAEAGRWLQYDMETTEDSVKRIIGSVLKEYGMSVSLTSKFVKVLHEAKKLKVDNFLELDPDIRIFCDGIKMARNEMDVETPFLMPPWSGGRNVRSTDSEQMDDCENDRAQFPVRPTTT
jgi:hypothetical protein